VREQDRGVAVTLDDEDAVRARAIQWVRRVTLDTTASITRDQLAGDFTVAGVRFPLIDRGRGIRKPAGGSAALSITTSPPTACTGTSSEGMRTVAVRTWPCGSLCSAAAR
jgi:hypothetical protein